MDTKIHPTAIVDTRAEIDTSVEIGPFCIVKAGVKIGKGTRLISHSVVEGTTEIGENCIIHPFASIGLPPQDLKYQGEDTKLIVGNNNILREYITLHRGSVGGEGITTVGDNNFLMAYVHIAHDCKVGNNNVMANAATLAGHVLVEDYVYIGGLVAIHQFTRVGKYAMIGGCSAIVQDVAPYMIASGSRAKLFGPNTIGLKRNGFTEDMIQGIKKAYKILFREKHTLQEAILKARREIPDSGEVAHLIHFIESSARGICR